jgi:hypothetical protein
MAFGISPPRQEHAKNYLKKCTSETNIFSFTGGYKLELLDEDNEFVRSLTSDTTSEMDAEWIAYDTTAQAHKVTLPRSLECEGCTIRLMRQAIEWGGSYKFWSCADVDIVSPGSMSASAKCSNNGRYNKRQGQRKKTKN